MAAVVGAWRRSHQSGLETVVHDGDFTVELGLTMRFTWRESQGRWLTKRRQWRRSGKVRQG